MTRRLGAPIGAFLIAAAVAACSDTPEPEVDGDLPIEPRFQELADRIDAERMSLGAPGAAVLVMEHGVVTFAHGFGTRTPGGDEPVDAGTLFRIGSVTKVLTATALLQEVAAGRVDLDEPVTRTLPDFSVLAPEDGAATIRVRDLLQHSSALADYLLIDDRHDDAGLDEYLTTFYPTQAYLMAQAGRMWNYSNPNFFLAGLIAERTAGVPYRTLLHDRVLAPLAMARTTFLPADVLADGNYATGASGSDVIAPDSYDNAWGRPAGYAFSSVHDLARFVGFLRDGDAAVLPEAARLAMQTTQIDTRLAAGHVGYGHGLFTHDGFRLADGYHAVDMIEHGGDIPGFAASVFYVPSTGFAFIALASADGAHLNASAAFALEHFAELGATSELPADLAIDPATFPALAGSYVDELNAGRVDITVADGVVTVSMPDVDAAGIPYQPVLQPLGADNFLLQIQGTGLQVTFLRAPDGLPVYMRTRAFVAMRAGANAQRARPVDVARLSQSITADTLAFLRMSW